MFGKLGKLFVGGCFAVGFYFLATSAGPWFIEKLEQLGEVAESIGNLF